MSPIERLTLFLDDRDNRSLSSARIKDGLPAADRIRAAVQLWQQGSAVADLINNRAADLRRARLARNSTSRERQIKVSVAALHQWQQDPQFQAAVDELAAELRRQRFADRATSDQPAATSDLTRTAS